MYSVLTCGTCVHDRKFAYDHPCNSCNELSSRHKKSNYEKLKIKECEVTGKSCDFGICSECI